MSVNSIRNLLEEAVASAPEKTALVHDHTRLSYAELFERVNKIAHYFNDLGLPKGSRIGIYSNKSVDQVIAILALLSTEYVFVPITRFLKPEQVAYIIEDAGISCIITDKIKAKTIEAVDFKGRVISYDPIDMECVTFEEIYKLFNGNFGCSIKGHDNAAMTYSFTSTGFPKGIVMTHQNFTDGARVVSKYLNITADDVLSGLLSFNLDYGLNQIFCAIYAKATLAIHKMLLPADFFTHLIRDRVTLLALMPIHITQMFDEDPHRLPRAEELEHIRAITSSGGKVTNKMLEDIERYFTKADFYSMHGLSEAFRCSYLDPAQIRIRPMSIGKAIPDVDLYVINEEGESCKPREIGELIHRGIGIYKGYWKSPEETAKRFKSIRILEKVIDLEGDLCDEIVVASGDYVYRDEEGYLYFVSRKDDMIKTMGYRVSPYEIETAVLNHVPGIRDCAVFSIENEEIEEEIVLVYSASAEIPRNEILFELKKHLPNYMLPSQIFYKKSIPRHYGKIDKETLKREVLESL